MGYAPTYPFTNHTPPHHPQLLAVHVPYAACGGRRARQLRWIMFLAGTYGVRDTYYLEERPVFGADRRGGMCGY